MFALGADLIVTPRFSTEGDYRASNIPVLMLFATLGMLMMVSANDLMTLYIGLEMSEPVALRARQLPARTTSRSSEAGLKYFVLGALASGICSTACSLVYGFTGSTGFAGTPPARPRRRFLDRCIVRPGLRARRPGLQDLAPCRSTCGRRTSTRRTDPGHGLLRQRAQGRGDGHAGADRDGSVRGEGRCLAADHHLRRAGIDRGRARSAQSGSRTSSACWPIRRSTTSGSSSSVLPRRPRRASPVLTYLTIYVAMDDRQLHRAADAARPGRHQPRTFADICRAFRPGVRRWLGACSR